MGKLPGYICDLSAESVSFVVGLPKQKQRKIIDMVELITASPERTSDYQTTDAIGRPIENLLLEEFCSPTGSITLQKRCRSPKS